MTTKKPEVKKFVRLSLLETKSMNYINISDKQSVLPIEILQPMPTFTSTLTLPKFGLIAVTLFEKENIIKTCSQFPDQ